MELIALFRVSMTFSENFCFSATFFTFNFTLHKKNTRSQAEEKKGKLVLKGCFFLCWNIFAVRQKNIKRTHCAQILNPIMR